MKCFPEQWKQALITPLYKSGNATDYDNYRPISVLPTLGKLLERLVHGQSTNYLKTRNLLCEEQSGFREGRSTATCLSEFLHTIYVGIDQGRACGVLFLDLAKAFDSVDHLIFLEKLKLLGLRNSAVLWYKSYLSSRTHCTKLNNVISKPTLVRHGVPQGSILGPLLFVCFLNDLPQFLLNSDVFLYADDTAIMVQGNDIPGISNILCGELRILHRWFCANKLHVNAKKSRSMLFHSKQKYRTDNELLLHLGTDPIEQVSCFKYQGMYLDEHLYFSSHIDNICTKKVRQRTRILWKLRGNISLELATQLFVSLIDPLFHLIW